jgi:stearoyl-CoA desaturase (delta-9 desaturase)
MALLIATLLMTHATIVCVTLYLHRGQAHKSIQFNPVVEHLMRFWLWLTTGMVTSQWVAIHRKHHSATDKPGDPHSPHVFGIDRVLWRGAWLYNHASKDTQMVNNFSKGTPTDWIERNLYTPHCKLGIVALLCLEVWLFHGWGIVMWLVQMAWVPFHAAGVVNGLGHWWGYRNTDTKDCSRNIFPWDFWIGGECLHNNHHANPASAKLSHKWWEFDIGWMYLCVLEILGLVRVVKR